MSSINNYMKSIAKFLVLNKEKIYSIGELYSELDKNYPEYYLRREENLKQFKLAIFNIDEEYENIHKFLIIIKIQMIARYILIMLIINHVYYQI